MRPVNKVRRLQNAAAQWRLSPVWSLRDIMETVIVYKQKQETMTDGDADR